ADAFGEGDDPAEPAPALGGAPWHYRVVEIHYSMVTLLRSGELSLSEELAKAAQAWTYSAALGRLQGLVPAYAYVAGRGWRQGKERGDRCWERLGKVGRESFVKRLDLVLGDAVAEAARWVRRVRREGAGWDVLPRPSVSELWPNMRADTDYRWHQAKLEIARELGEITLLRTVGPAHRERAHARGIERWDDPRVSAALLEVGEKDAPILDAILAVHRGDEPVLPRRIAAGGDAWRVRAPVELYVDFETVNDLADDLSAFPAKGGTPLIFQVGCGRYEDGRWTFRQFTARDLTVAAEGEMLDEWIAYLRDVARDAGVDVSEVRLFHWSSAETVSMDKEYGSARDRHRDRDWPELGWYDLLTTVVRAEPVVIKGSMAFGLKSVARAMHANGLIRTLWGEGLADGTGAMAAAWLAAAEARRTGVALRDVPVMREVERYNEIDCRVMAEVLDHLRREH
ncbi:MAG TPA: hypothetical protein VFM93_07985, partial [Candidatus Limnocylindria bacterium]|nr:hypothetical protein [Candidatus Limnocylindria bacterium]